MRSSIQAFQRTRERKQSVEGEQDILSGRGQAEYGRDNRQVHPAERRAKHGCRCDGYTTTNPLLVDRCSRSSTTFRASESEWSGYVLTKQLLYLVRNNAAISVSARVRAVIEGLGKGPRRRSELIFATPPSQLDPWPVVSPLLTLFLLLHSSAAWKWPGSNELEE